jgi:hypothetical protein
MNANSIEHILSSALSLLQEMPMEQTLLVGEDLYKALAFSKPHANPAKEKPLIKKQAATTPTFMEEKPKLAPPISTELKEVALPPQKEEEAFIPKDLLVPSLPFDELEEKLKKLFPHFAIHAKPPSDKIASFHANPLYLKACQAQAAILSFQESKESDLFLQNIQKALISYNISAHFWPVRSLEEARQFLKESQAKIVLSSPRVLTHPPLLSLVRELPMEQKRFIETIPLVILEPFETYFTNKDSKKTLWQTLCTALKKNSTPESS